MTRHAGQIVGLYRRHAHAWAAARAAGSVGRVGEAAWLDRLLALLPPRPAVLDVGCGAGEPIARILASRGCALTGIDSSPEMIALCRAGLPDQDWRVADMRSLALGRRFDAVLAWDSLFHLDHDDQRRTIPLLCAHAAPGAALLFTSGPRHGESIGTFEGEPLYHASLSGAEYRALLAAQDFGVVDHVVEDTACGGRTVWLAQAMSPAPALQGEAASSSRQ